MEVVEKDFMKCDVCHKHSTKYIEIIYQGVRIWICKPCIKKALTMIEEAEDASNP